MGRAIGLHGEFITIILRLEPCGISPIPLFTKRKMVLPNERAYIWRLPPPPSTFS